jgi:hypothetical protein
MRRFLGILFHLAGAESFLKQRWNTIANEEKIRMTINSIVAVIDSEIERLEEARALLSGIERGKSKAAPPPKVSTRRKLSAAARKRIAAAQKKRWAEVRAKRSARNASAKGTAIKKTTKAKAASSKKGTPPPAQAAA